jgi:hypothetical protein
MARRKRVGRPVKRKHHSAKVSGLPGFSQRLFELSKGISLARVGSMTRTHPETVRRYMVGMSKPSLEFVVGVCRGFKVSADWLLFGKGKK